MFAVTIGAIDLQGCKKCVYHLDERAYKIGLTTPYMLFSICFKYILLKKYIYVDIYVQRSSKTNRIFGNRLL